MVFFTFFGLKIFMLTLGLLHANVSDHRMSQGLRIGRSKRFIQMTCSADRGRAGRGFCTLMTMQNKHQTNVNYFYFRISTFYSRA